LQKSFHLLPLLVRSMSPISRKRWMKKCVICFYEMLMNVFGPLCWGLELIRKELNWLLEIASILSHIIRTIRFTRLALTSAAQCSASDTASPLAAQIHQPGRLPGSTLRPSAISTSPVINTR
jgi:hypothetical protein